MDTRFVHLGPFADVRTATDALNGIVNTPRRDERFSVNFMVVRVRSFQVVPQGGSFHVIALVETKE
jgi:hypothetical protein